MEMSEAGMRLTILGSGTLVPSATRNSAGYFVELPSARIMLDCGAGSVHALARDGLPWESLTHVFISHLHVDHVGELASLFYALKYGIKTKRKEPLMLLGPQGLDRVVRGLAQAFGAKLFEPSFPFSLMLLEPGQRMQVGDDSYLSVAKTPHTPESLAVRIDTAKRSLCYTGDTAFSEDLPRFFNKADLLISECSFREPREGLAHLSVKDVATMARLSDVARLVVTHFYFDVNEDELTRDLRRDYPGEVFIGRDGLTIEL